MKPVCRTLPAVIAAIAGTAFVSVALGQNAGNAIPDRYIVQLRPGVDSVSVAVANGIGQARHFSAVLNGFAATLPPGLARQLAANPDVEAVYPDHVVEAFARPPGSGGGGGGGSSSQVVPEGIRRIGAQPGALAFNGAGVGVAIVDTGIDYNHSDLAPSPVQYNALLGAVASNAQDDNGHGTHVSGTVAALNNTSGVVGVAPGATLYGVKVLNAQGSGSDSEILAGLDWILANADTVNPPIRVINMSLGRPVLTAYGETPENTVWRAPMENLVAAGITVVVAAGNDCGVEVSDLIPGCIPAVLSVGGTTARNGTSATSLAPIAADSPCYFTTDGALDANGVGVSVSAPGEDQENIIKGNRLQSVGILSTLLGGGTTRMGGTSMASPHAAGVAALLVQKDPLATPAKIKARIQAGAARIGVAPLDGRTTCFDFDGVREGILSAPGALAAP